MAVDVITAHMYGNYKLRICNYPFKLIIISSCRSKSHSDVGKSSSPAAAAANNARPSSRGKDKSSDVLAGAVVKQRSSVTRTATDCMVCEEMFACVTFQPCGHVVVCVECCQRMKTCLKCQHKIEHKYGPGTDYFRVC